MPPKGGFNEASLKGWDLRAELPLAKVVDPSVYIKMKFVGSTPYSEWTHKIKLFLDFENPLSSSKFTLRSTARLPLKPHFPGFLIDTLFWGALWLALIATWRTLRTRHRRTRGLCIKLPTRRPPHLPRVRHLGNRRTPSLSEAKARIPNHRNHPSRRPRHPCEQSGRRGRCR